MTRETFTLKLRAEPGWDVPANARLKRALKFMLRSCGLRCIYCVDCPEGPLEKSDDEAEVSRLRPVRTDP